MSISFNEKPDSLRLEKLPRLEHVTNFFQIIEILDRIPFGQINVDCSSTSTPFNFIRIKINDSKRLAAKTRIELVCVFKSNIIPNPLQPELPGYVLKIQTDDTVLVSGDFVAYNQSKLITTVPFESYKSKSNINRRRHLFSLDNASIENITASVALTMNQVINEYNNEIETYLY